MFDKPILPGPDLQAALTRLPPGLDLRVMQDLARQKLARERFDWFIRYTRPDYVFEPLHTFLANKLQRFVEDCEAGRSPRLLITLPPQHGKSTQTSEHLPAFILGRNPKWHVALASYSADYAENLGRKARLVVESESYRRLWPQLKLADDRTAAGQWEFVRSVGGGGMKSVGRDGGITGNPANVLIFDDLIKNRDEAYSDTLRQKIWDGIGPNFMTRLQKGAGVLAVATWWHHDDPIGRFIRLADEGGEPFEIIRFEAIAPDSGDPLGRAPGEALAPNLHPIDELIALRDGGTLTESDWQALYCSRPTAESGAIFKSEWIERNQEPDPGGPGWVFQAIDTAYSEKRTADYTVVSTWRVEPTCYRLLHVARARLAFPELKRQIPELAAVWNPVAIVVEDIGSGKSLAQELKAETRLPIVEWKPDRDKAARANAVTPLFAADRVKLPVRAPWLRDWIAEHLQFPAAAHDDQVDTTTMALTWAREQEPKVLPTVQRNYDFTVDKDMDSPDSPRWLNTFEAAQAAAYKALEDLQSGNPITCTKHQYRVAVRMAIQAQIDEWQDEGQHIYAQIAQAELERLDNLHGRY